MAAQCWHVALHETLRDPSRPFSLLYQRLAGGWRDRSQQKGTSQLFLMKRRLLEAATLLLSSLWSMATLSCKLQSLMGVRRLTSGVGICDKHLCYAVERAEDEIWKRARTSATLASWSFCLTYKSFSALVNPQNDTVRYYVRLENKKIKMRIINYSKVNRLELGRGVHY